MSPCLYLAQVARAGRGIAFPRLGLNKVPVRAPPMFTTTVTMDRPVPFSPRLYPQLDCILNTAQEFFNLKSFQSPDEKTTQTKQKFRYTNFYSYGIQYM